MKVFIQKYWLILTIIFSILGATGGLFALEDRWNQAPTIKLICSDVKHLETNVLAGFKAFQRESNLQRLEGRLSYLYDQLKAANYDLRRSPNDQIIIDRIR